MIQTSPEPELLGSLGRVDAALAGDAASIARALTERTSPAAAGRIAWKKGCRGAYLRNMEAVRGDARGNSSGAAINALGEAAQPGDVVVLDGRESGYWGSLLCPAGSYNTRFRAWGLRGFGYGFPMALGVKLARPRDRVMALCDTEALLHHLQELDTARREDIRVTVCVVGEGYNWREVAEGFGLFGAEARTPAELMTSLERADRSGKAAVIDLTGFET